MNVGRMSEGEVVVRVMIDMMLFNFVFRDWFVLRIQYVFYFFVGSRYKVWLFLDF